MKMLFVSLGWSVLEKLCPLSWVPKYLEYPRPRAQKTKKSLHLSDNNVVNTEEEILKGAKSFYQKLHSSTVSSIDNQCDETFFPLGNIETLTKREQNECGWRRLNAGKVSIPCNQIKTNLLNALRPECMKGCLCITQRRGIITSIP